MMDMKFNEEWLRKVAAEEEGVRFSVGGWATDLETEFGSELSGLRAVQSAPEETDAKHVQLENVFGQYLNMARRERGLSVQDLAANLGMNPYDLLLLEQGKEHPEPRIISKIASFFGVPGRKLAEIAGLMTPDTITAKAALAFAASSSTKPLDPEQKEALHELVRALSDM